MQKKVITFIVLIGAVLISLFVLMPPKHAPESTAAADVIIPPIVIEVPSAQEQPSQGIQHSMDERSNRSRHILLQQHVIIDQLQNMRKR